MKISLMVLMLAAVLAGCSGKEEAPATGAGKAQQPVAAGDPAGGKAVAERYCKGCHGADGKGAAPGIPNLAAQKAGYLLASLQEYKDGKRTHAALKDLATTLTEANLRNVAAYYASLPAIKPATGQAAPVLPYDAGAQKARECVQCHGPDGNGKTPGIPTLAGQQPAYLAAAMQEYLRGLRKSSPMHDLLRHLDRTERENLALYFASQAPVERQSAAFGDPTAGEPLSAVCGGCHGAYGVSNDAATPSLAGQDAEYLVEAIKAYRAATRKHAVMQKQIAALSDKDIANLAAFYTVQRSKPALKGQRLIQDLAEKCDRCHAGTDNPSMVVPNIQGQDRDYLVMALRAYRDDTRESTVMHRMSLPFGDTVVESLADLYAGRSPK